MMALRMPQLYPVLLQCLFISFSRNPMGWFFGSGFQDLLPECCNSRNRSVSTKMILPKDYLNNYKIQRNYVGICPYTHMQLNFVPTLIWLIAGWWYLQCVNIGCAVILQWGISAGIEKKKHSEMNPQIGINPFSLSIPLSWLWYAFLCVFVSCVYCVYFAHVPYMLFLLMCSPHVTEM